MGSDIDPLVLAAEFPAVTREQWRELVAATLRLDAGTDPEAALTSHTYEGVEIRPLYTAEDGGQETGLPGRPRFVRGATTRAGWEVRQRHADPDAGANNSAVRADLHSGVTSLWLVLGAGCIAIDDLPAVLDGVDLARVPVALDAGAAAGQAADALVRLAREQGTAPERLSGSLGADPIGVRARTGAAADLSQLAGLAELAPDAPELRVATVDGTVYHDAGGSDGDEIALATAAGVAYLRALTDAGLSVDAALDRIEFRFAVTADQFGSIVKLRAARGVWHRVAELSGASPQRRGQHQHAVTSAAMLTRRDPWVNLLRATIGCFAAAVGGADAITVLPFDNAIGRPDEFARRIARNTQSILHDEASLARVADAAGGSWYVEARTEALAQAAWDSFTAIERAGGALAALDAGVVEGLIGTARAARDADIAHRRAPITGVSEYADLDEAPVHRVPASAAGGGRLVAHRYAEQFEALRDRADAAAQRPVVFLAALGPFAAHGARAGFAANLFAAGGIGTVTGTGTPDELADAFRASGSALACLAGSDADYAAEGAAVAAALRASGAGQVWLAGPADVAGVDTTVTAGCDALAVLRSAFDVLGVPA